MDDTGVVQDQQVTGAHPHRVGDLVQRLGQRLQGSTSRRVAGFQQFTVEGEPRISGITVDDQHVRLRARSVRVTEGQVRAACQTVLAENLWEEFGEGNPDQAHAVLLDNLLESMGVGRDQLDCPATDGTLAFLTTQRDLTTSSAWRGVGAFCYANEYLSLAEFRPLEAAIRSRFPAAHLSYFTENMKADTRHTELLESLIDAAAETPSNRADIEYGVSAALDARCRFYDSLVPWEAE